LLKESCKRIDLRLRFPEAERCVVVGQQPFSGKRVATLQVVVEAGTRIGQALLPVAWARTCSAVAPCCPPCPEGDIVPDMLRPPAGGEREMSVRRPAGDLATRKTVCVSIQRKVLRAG
jgi:hypothetical protein